ncbi:insulinase family protein [Alloiococcus sp. CFN-8]|uniref:insulinase family protein n=1 Tax=Alloiococcus sp. CFN-8 TaxID=3416081 RepID=UPI003CF7310F
MEKDYNSFGFKLVEKHEVKEIKSNALIFIHEKTGARLLKLENSDDNKVFTIGFKTPPENSTGVAHIIEHSVLCGSEKYRSKEPFVELLKGSLNTFLNAMTFADKTIYPVASRNTKDFHNLMDVYLDAVFNPLIYSEPLIFMQEGWHYELNSPEDQLTINGVVYNEMKGVYSSPDSLLYRYIPSSLLPDTTYGVDSGGDPDEIPELSYEEFLAFHKKYYHPSNSFIYLYGNGNLQEELKVIDEYISKYSKAEPALDIPEQSPFKELKEYKIPYTIDEEESIEEKTYLSLNFAIGTALDTELTLAFQILTYLLLQNPAAPLKKALIEADLGKTVIGDFDSSSKTPIFSVVVKNSDENKQEKFKKVFYATLRELIDKGIPKEIIEGSINYQEFLLRESDFRGYPKGIIYYMSAMETWLHGGAPIASLEYEDSLNKIKSALNTDYFEKLIEKYILNNNHCSLVILKPEPGLGASNNHALEEKLRKYKESLSPEETQNIIKNTKQLRIRQESLDSEEVLKTIPMLELQDVSPEAEMLPMEVKEEEKIKVLYSNVFTNKIGYINLLFNTKHIPEELIQYTRLLGSLFSKISTENYGYEEIVNMININTGGISFSVSSTVEKNDHSSFNPLFVIKGKALIEKLPKLTELILEIINNTIFTEKDRILNIIREEKSRLESTIYNSGNAIASLKVLSYLTSKGVFDERIRGYSYYKFICDLEENYQERYSDIVSKLKDIKAKIFNLNSLIISFTAEAESYDAIKSMAKSLNNELTKEEITTYDYKFSPEADNEGLTTEAKIQYVAKGFNYKALGYNYSGAFRVIENILTLDYLWNKVRVIGGAYGVSVNILKDGNVYISSYRDPKLVETLEAYNSIGDYLTNLDLSERELTKYILGTVSRLDFPLTPSMIGEISYMRYLAGITYEQLQKERDEILNLSVDIIKEYSKMFSKGMEEDYICVLGNNKKINDNKGLFKEIKKVFKTTD